MLNQFVKTSELRLQAGLQNGKTILEDVYFTAPYKIMKPFPLPGGGISVMPLCASAGIMAGDVQVFDYKVGAGAALEILSQSFEKIHKMDEGCARREIRVDLASGGTLFYNPQPVIPFAGSAFDSDMKIQLADETSKLFLLDILSCGRAASGERFGYRRFKSKVQIWRDGKLIYRDNTCYEPEKMPMEGLGMYEGYSHMANIFMTADEDAAALQEQIWTILEGETECEGGVTHLSGGDLAVRIFGNRAQVLQEMAEKIKDLI